jgi:hypothetical protein
MEYTKMGGGGLYYLPVITNNYDWKFMVKCYACQSVPLPVHYGLHTYWPVLVNIQVKDMNFTIVCYSSEHGTGIRGPFHISHCISQIKHKQWITGKMGKTTFIDGDHTQ